MARDRDVANYGWPTTSGGSGGINGDVRIRGSGLGGRLDEGS